MKGEIWKVLFAALKYEEQYAFQKVAIELHKQPKKTKKEHIRLVISSIRVGVVTKTDDEIYVLNTVKTYIWGSQSTTTMTSII